MGRLSPGTYELTVEVVSELTGRRQHDSLT